MGLFSTVLHLFEREQADVISGLTEELRENHGFNTFGRIAIEDSNYEQVLNEQVYSQSGLFYLVTSRHGRWITVIEVNVNSETPIYLYELTDGLSKRLSTYALSFHLHDGDVLLYNLSQNGTPLDGYNSNYQYFQTEPAISKEIESQRHVPELFKPVLLPGGKGIEGLKDMLNEGYWNAFDNNHLDMDGIPNGEKYDVDEGDRFARIGEYLEIYDSDSYPFAAWRDNILAIDLGRCYLLKAGN